jgi:hypothetical protein
VRCARCGNDNPATNRFCGMCGATLLPAPTPAAPPPRDLVRETVPESLPPATVSLPRPPVRTPTEVPPISGHSFLGLNQPSSSESARAASLGRGSQLERSSGSLDYLLEDEEAPRGGGAGKIFVILMLIVLALGFAYYRWHDQLSALVEGTKKAVVAEPPAPDAGQTPATPTLSPDSAASSGSTTPAPQNTSPPAGDSSAPAAAAPPPAGTNPRGTQPPASGDSATSAAPQPATGANPPAQAQPAEANNESDGVSAANSDESADPNTETAAPAPVRSAKPHSIPKPTAATPADSVAEAEKFIYGRGGVRQDCDRGLRTLRPAAEQANPNAMISLGALYSTGVCTPRDLPTAYRWFARALRKAPDNQPLQENLQRLWSQMTQPEKQLAIKLSQ